MALVNLITGITGQDGAYLAQNLLKRGEIVYGAVRRSSSSNLDRLVELGIEREIRIVDLDLIEQSNIINTIDKLKPDRIYNLAAQSFVAASFVQPIYTTDINALGVLRLLEAIRVVSPTIKLYQASTSEMFGDSLHLPQNELTPFNPQSPYASAKCFAHHTIGNYRRAYNLFCCAGILFNHESPLRGREFVTRKITLGFAKIKLGMAQSIALGNLDSKRDWGYAEEYVEGMRLMLEQNEADDYILATGISTTVREFVSYVAEYFGYEITWQGNGIDEVGIDKHQGQKLITIDKSFYRPAEVPHLLGDSSKALQKFGWKSNVSAKELAHIMAESDFRKLAK